MTRVENSLAMRKESSHHLPPIICRVWVVGLRMHSEVGVVAPTVSGRIAMEEVLSDESYVVLCCSAGRLRAFAHGLGDLHGTTR